MKKPKGNGYLSYHEARLLFGKSPNLNQMPEKLTPFDEIHQEKDSEIIL